MRLTKRILLSLMEVGFLVFLFILTSALAIFLESVAKIHYEYGLLLGTAFSLYGWFLTQKSTRQWKIEYDAARWIEKRSKLTLHPHRARYLRLARRSLLWVPSAFASLVLFFFPIATHLVHPSVRLKHYRISLPWTWTVLLPLFVSEEYSYVDALISANPLGRLGVTPFWDTDTSFSVVTFGSFGHPNEHRRDGATQVSERDFNLGVSTLACWQYLPSDKMRFWHALPKTYWQIDCDISGSRFDLDFWAQFSGREQDIPAFYGVLEHVTRTD